MLDQQVDSQVASVFRPHNKNFRARCSLTHCCPPLVIVGIVTDCFDEGAAIELPKDYSLVEILEKVDCPCGIPGYEMDFSRQHTEELAVVGKAILALHDTGALRVHLQPREIASIKLLVDSAAK
jgi:hypothetical protein